MPLKLGRNLLKKVQKKILRYTVNGELLNSLIQEMVGAESVSRVKVGLDKFMVNRSIRIY